MKIIHFSKIKMEDNTFKKVKHLQIGDSIVGDSAFPDNNVIIAIFKYTGIYPCLFHNICR